MFYVGIALQLCSGKARRRKIGFCGVLVVLKTLLLVAGVLWQINLGASHVLYIYIVTMCTLNSSQGKQRISVFHRFSEGKHTTSTHCTKFRWMALFGRGFVAIHTPWENFKCFLKNFCVHCSSARRG